MKSIIKKICVLTLIPLASIELASCSTSQNEEKKKNKIDTVEKAANQLEGLSTANKEYYQKQLDKSDFISLELKSNNKINLKELDNVDVNLNSQIVLNLKNLLGDSSNKNTNVNDIKLSSYLDTMYLNLLAASEEKTELTAGYYDSIFYVEAKEGENDTKYKISDVDNFIKDFIKIGSSELTIEEDNNYYLQTLLPFLNTFKNNTLGWLAGKIETNYYVDLIAQFAIAQDPELATTYLVCKQDLIDICEYSKQSIDLLIKVDGNEDSFKIESNEKNAISFLNKIKEFSDNKKEDTTKSEIAKSLYSSLSESISEYLKDPYVYSVSFELDFKEKAISGVKFDAKLNFKNDNVTNELQTSSEFKISSGKIDVTKLENLDSFNEFKFEDASF